MSGFQRLLSQHIASSLLKQQRLSDFLGDHNWNVDMNAGTVDFGEGRVYPIQILGSESEVNATWLWGWANTGSNIPPSLLNCAQTMRELGQKEGIEELTEAQFALDEVDGHFLSIVACGICGADAYYQGAYDGGSVFFLIQQSPLGEVQPSSSIELVNAISYILSEFSVDNRVMARSFLQQQGYQITEISDKITASHTGDVIAVSFDTLGRISNLETTALP